ncbi:MAG TPA: ERF family protein [Ohtaekwangia sp.]|nr:ERF family protein [Ohtaekwangia sp.]
MDTKLKTVNGEIVPQESMNPAQLLTLAVDKDLDISKLERLMELQKAWQLDQARKSFFAALAKFQSEVPEIRKSKAVAFNEVKYNYAPLADVVRQIKDTCRDCGLSYRWEIKDTKEEIAVTCLVTHTDGHTEQTTMTANPDDSGKKNKIQQRGSSIEYLKRYTLIGALGLSTTDSDIDGIMPEISIDILHKQFMEHYNELIQLDSTATRFHPDNWRGDKTQKLYMKAITEIRKKLIQATPKKA